MQLHSLLLNGKTKWAALIRFTQIRRADSTTANETHVCTVKCPLIILVQVI